jgi:2-dehydro-3-deoxy-D-gluconate 5-dehydrogenase
MEQNIDQLLSLKNKTAIVTGAAMGIGFAIAKRLHEAGANVVLVDLHHDNVHESAGILHELRGDSVYAIHGDVSDINVAEEAVKKAVEHFGGVDILVNNAGIFPVKLLADMTEQDFNKVISVNLKSVFLFTKFVSEQMKVQGSEGRIINITSIDALHPSMPGLAHYDASKHGVWGFTKNTALELANYKIWVNAIAPGGVATPGVTNMHGNNDASAEQLEAQTDAFLSIIPMHRMADPDEIAKVALFLASDMSSYMTGSQIVVDGGALLT